MGGERSWSQTADARVGVGWRAAPEPQPGDRNPAPGELALVQSFINSHYDLVVEHGRDLFAAPSGLERWFAERGLLEPEDGRLDDADVGRAIAVREGLRALARALPESLDGAVPDSHDAALAVHDDFLERHGSDGAQAADLLAPLNDAARGAPLELRFTTGGPRFVRAQAAAGAPLSLALGVVLAIAARAMIEGTWARLKVCPGDHCGWAFYDHSRNQSGRWCSMAVCGGRAKARSHYRRTRTTGG
jgi:hypothetical protein